MALVSALGIAISSCGVTDTVDGSDLDTNDDTDETDNDNSNNDGNSGTSAFSVDGNTITIDTSVSGEALASAGGWLIASEYGFLAINVDGTASVLSVMCVLTLVAEMPGRFQTKHLSVLVTIQYSILWPSC